MAWGKDNAAASGLDGVVCSGHEVEAIKSRFSDSTGKVIWDGHQQQERHRVFSESTAYMVVDMLKQAVSSGTYSDGLINLLIQFFGGSSVDFIDGPYWAKMFVLCFYTIWIVMPFKILILTSALASVNPMYYNAAKVDGTSRFRMFTKITLPMISPMVFYLIITGFIGAFKAYSDAVALFGTNLNAAEMNTIVGYVYDMLYGDSGGYPSYASAAAILLFAIVLTITCINLLVSKKHVHYV